jgi:hypothetical protein
VARKLHALLADEWRRRGAAGGGDGARKRPLLVLLDRHCDLATPLRHTETYQALVDDVLDHEANVASFADESGSKKVDLRVDEDGFYGEHAAKSFPDVIDASGEALATLRAAENALRARGAGQDATEADGDAAKLAETVGELPALLARKKLLEHHTGQDKRAKFQTSKPHISAVFHSFWLIFGRAIISWNGLDAWMLFPGRARAEHSR